MVRTCRRRATLAVGFHRLGGSRIGHGAGEGGHIKPDVAGGVGKHLPVGDIARFSEMGDLDTVEQVPVRRLTTDGFGGLAGKRRFPGRADSRSGHCASLRRRSDRAGH
jgi:hypothetical protein